MIAVAAINKLGFIGRHNSLMWRSPQDLKHFSQLTKNGKVILGRKTYESLPNKELPNRELLVIGKDYNSIDEILERYSKSNFKDLYYLIGGESIYRELLKYCHTLHLSVIDDYQVGDKRFPIEKFNGIIKTYEFKCK